jgi:TM2 domain-containing membrane protein YozV
VSNQAPACPGCGHQLKPPAVPAAPAPISISIDQAMVRVPKSRAVYIILGLFLGGLGVHNFYIGRVATGLIQLLITLLLGWLFVPLFIVGFWVIIEVIAVNADAEGHRLR